MSDFQKRELADCESDKAGVDGADNSYFQYVFRRECDCKLRQDYCGAEGFPEDGDRGGEERAEGDEEGDWEECGGGFLFVLIDQLIILNLN